MSYKVLARKWRPKNFRQIAGQEHVVRALVNALDNDRLHHAYLFSGTRGVGKTTIARIFAKSLNCEAGISSEPCGTCASCLEIDEGRFVDLIEVDAASRTRVEETRELLDNVQYAPTRGRYKVYLIDEVHMFSAHSFNALLKTLEEPPLHVVFLLATTDPQKLPVTILSRCLQFNLKKLPPTLITDYLSSVLGQEGIEHEESALRLIAKAADGSMRDALSLIDQSIAYGGGSIGEKDVRAMLGTIDTNHVSRLLQLVAGNDAAGILDYLAEIDAMAPDYYGLLDELISMLHQVAVSQHVPGAISETADNRKDILELGRMITPEDVQLYYQIALLGRRDLAYIPDSRAGLEMTLLRMVAFRPATPGTDEEHARVSAAVKTATVPAASAPAGSNRQAVAGKQQAYTVVATAREPAPQPSGSTDVEDWLRIIESMNLSGLEKQLAMNCILASQDDETFRLLLDPEHKNLDNPKMRDRIQQSLRELHGNNINLALEMADGSVFTPARLLQQRSEARQAEAVNAIRQDENVKSICDIFDARIDDTSIQSVD
jgi:DNA polymerase-3 subunit gamma/tau